MFGRISGFRFGLAALGVALGSAIASAVEFNEIARFDVNFAFDADLNNDNNPDGLSDNPKYIGNNSLAIAWNGSKLYIAGFDNVSSFPGVGIIELLNATSTGLVTTVDSNYSPLFGALVPPVSRGYTGLAINGNRLAASYDAGSADIAAIQLFDTSNNTEVWDLSVANPAGDRAGSGVAFDPGFNGSAGGQGVAWTKFGQGRRALLNQATGAEIHGFTGSTSPGFIWAANPLPAGDTNNARDMDFDPDTGDIYVRRSNDVDKAVRTGDNASTPQAPIVNATDAPFILGQKLEFLSNTVDGDLVIYNDRPSNAFGGLFTDAVKVINPSGAAQTATFNLIAGSDPIAAGSSIYDFDFDPVSQTLAVMDFSNRNIHIFKVGPLSAGIVGDYDNDGGIDAGDYDAWKAAFGTSTALPNLSPTKVGTEIDASDYTVWRDALGGSGVVAAAAVPEPASLALVSLIVGASFFIRRK